MRLQLGLLAAAANTSGEGTLNILGEFNVIFVSGGGNVVQMPAVLVLRLVAEPQELGSHTLGIRLRTEDGRLLWTSPDTPIAFAPTGIPGLPSRAQIIVALHPMTLASVGSFAFEVVVDSHHIDDVEVHVVERPASPA